MQPIKQMAFALLLVCMTGLMYGCSVLNSQSVSHNKSSVVDYLYPQKNKVHVKPSIPVLKLPTKVGVAFVPERYSNKRLTAIDKTKLLERVAKHFKKYPYISEIAIIPTDYLTKGGSFANLDQIRTMYGIDLVALVSYDQVQFNDNDFLSLSYWTIVGAYLISGEKNDTSTMLDTVVYDIASRSMLFRAPGTSQVKGRSTPVNLDEQLRKDSKKGFNIAADQMVVNLDAQLKQFEARAKKPSKKLVVEARQGYEGTAAGGGAFSFGFLLMLAMLFAGRLLFVKQKA